MIPASVIYKLIDDKLIFQEGEHNNIVFVNRDETFAEVHGTNSFSKPFHGVVKGSDRLAYWWFKSYHIDATISKIFICESAIDAMSLYCLHQVQSFTPSYTYCSIAGVANQQRVDVIKNLDVETVLAVNDDSAGEKCRKRNSELSFAIPELKDWNEDWCKCVQDIRTGKRAKGRFDLFAL